MEAIPFDLPYAALVPRLVNSVTRALAELVLDQPVDGAPVADHQILNRHFAWLGVQFPDGVNRHLYGGDPGNGYHPLRTVHLRWRLKLPAQITSMFENGDSIPTANMDWMEKYVRAEPTRISKLIFDAVERSNASRREASAGANLGERKRSPRIWSPSPLAIVFDFLTMPSHPGSRSFALLTLRNYLFERLSLVPDQSRPDQRFKSFSERDIEEAMSVIWTSFRPRFYSKGQDKLPSRGRGAISGDVDALVRHFLAMNGIFDLSFKSPANISSVDGSTSRTSSNSIECPIFAICPSSARS